MLETQVHDVFHLDLMLYHGAEFTYVRVQLAFSYTVLVCLPSKKQGTVAFHVLFGRSISVRPPS